MTPSQTKVWRMAVLLACLVFTGGCSQSRIEDPAERIREGWRWYSQGDFDLAAKEFNGALAYSRPDSPVNIQARHGLATVWDLRRPGNDADRATALYREVIAAAPTNDLAAWSTLAMARMKARIPSPDKSDRKALLDAYQEVIDKFPAHPAAEEAFLLQQAARLSLPQGEEARAVLESLDEFLRVHPESPNRSTVYALMAHCCEVLGLHDRLAEAVFQQWKTSETDPANPVQDLSWTYWRIATVAEFRTGDFAVAREYYRKLIDEYPTEQRVFLARQELKRMNELEAGIRQEEVKRNHP